jgi:ABC-type oligopeptide transport system ATPase subunit
MYLGRIAESGPKDQVYETSRASVHRALLSAAPAADPTRPRRQRIILTGDVPSPDQSAGRLPVPSPLPEGAGTVRPAGAGT